MAEAAADPPFPHISNVKEWGGHPDRNYYVFAVLSVVFGFFGLDHFYLRSFETGFKKIVVNILGLGIWYVWDVIQILSDGAKIRKEGLSSPLDWIRGIGHGVFADSSKKGEEFSAKKSYLVYAMLAIFLGCFGLDKFYMGCIWQGVAKLLSCFNIFLFLFGWLWVLWDAFHAFFMTKSILTNGITPPMPYSFIFNTISGDAFMVNPPGTVVKSGCSLNPFKGLSNKLLNLPGMSYLGSVNPFEWVAETVDLPPVPDFKFVRGAYKDIVAPLLTVPVIKALQTASSAVPSMPATTMPGMPGMPGMPEMPGVPKVAMPGMPEIPGVPKVAMPKVAKAKQSGGGSDIIVGGGEGGGPGPVIAGALTAVVLAGGLKGLYDMISSR